MADKFGLSMHAFPEDAQRSGQDEIERVSGFSGKIERLAGGDRKPDGFLACRLHGAGRNILQEFNGPQAGSDINAHVEEHAHFDSLFKAFRSSPVFQIRMTPA